MSHSFSTYHPISEQGTRHAHPRASAAAMSRHVQRSHKGYTLTHAGHQIRIGPVAFWIVVGALVVMGVWSIATGTYFAFRENVLTRLIGRQAEMQFAYEDRIAELRAQVDRVMSRQLLDQEQFEQKLNTLLQRQATLEQRTKALGGEALTTGTVKPSRVAPPGAAERTPRASPINDTVIFVVPPDREARLYSRELSGGGNTDCGTHDERRAHRRTLAHCRYRWTRSSKRNRRPSRILKSVIDTRARRMRSVLADLGVDPVRSRGEGPVGGPFVPIKPPQAGASAFERQLYRVNVARAQIDRYTHTLVAVPVRKPIIGDVDMSSPFGMRMDPFHGRPAVHTGIDLRGDTGEPVRATATGRVTIAGREGGYGNMIEINHGNGLASRYGHLSQIGVKVGQFVRIGETIGRIGSTGRSTGPSSSL